MFLVTRVLDAITDPLTGIVADRVKTRWGHFRPWLIWFTVPYAVLAVMTFDRNLAHRVNWFMPT
jgi:Na+/melibiose symporter-like transporter